MAGCVDQLVALPEVVEHGGLVEDVGDHTVQLGAERIVRGLFSFNGLEQKVGLPW